MDALRGLERMRRPMKKAVLFAVILCTAMPLARAEEKTAAAAPPAWMRETSARLEKELGGKTDEAGRGRLSRGLKQVGGFWRAEDGDAAAFEDFVRTNFASMFSWSASLRICSMGTSSSIASSRR